MSAKTHRAGYIDYSVVVCISTVTRKDKTFPLPKSIEQQTAEQYQGSANCGDLDLNSDINRPASGKLW